MKTKYRFWTKEEHKQFGKPKYGWNEDMNFLYGLPITTALFDSIEAGALDRLKFSETFLKEELTAAGHTIDESRNYNWSISMDMVRRVAEDEYESTPSVTNSEDYLLL